MWRHRWPAAAAAAVAGGVYVATMYPGLVGIGDTPKFQFVGSVLGTPHSPGYPLYIVLSWLFTHIPIGTIAYRVNLLSAVSGACVAGLSAAVLQELGCRPMIAFASAAAIAFGDLFWSQAILAEVYALNLALFAGVLLFLLRWSRTRSLGDLTCAIALFAAGLAHHLTLAMTGPALLLYALAIDRRIVTPRVVAIAVSGCALGLASYGLIWLRTAEAAPFLEARAQSVRELVHVVSAQQFHRALFAFSPAELVTARLPLIAHWLASELRWPGVSLAVIGAAALYRKQRREFGLLIGCFGLVTFFATNYDVFDVQVFLLIPMLVLGLIAAVGLESLARAVRWRGAAAAAAISLVALAVPAAQYRANIHHNNQRRHTYEMRFFGSLFDALPDGSAIVAESYTIDNMVLYELIGERRARGRRIELIKPDVPTIRRHLEHGDRVFAFAQARATLEFEGISFQPADLPLPMPSSGKHVADTEAPELAFGLAMAQMTPVTTRAVATSGEPTTIASEPFSGAVWRPVGR